MSSELFRRAVAVAVSPFRVAIRSFTRRAITPPRRVHFRPISGAAFRLETLDSRSYVNSPISFGPDGLTLALVGTTYNAAFNTTALFMDGTPSATEKVGTVDYNSSTLTDPVTGINYGNTPFLLHYSGDFLVNTTDTYHFQIPNADGAILFVDGAPVIYAASLAGDANLDGVVDSLDTDRILGTYYNNGGNRVWTDGDVTGEGSVNFFDISEAESYYYDSNTTVSAGPINANTNYMVDDGWLNDGINLSSTVNGGHHHFDLYTFQLNNTGSPFAALQWQGTNYNNTGWQTMTGAPAIVDGPTIAATKGPAVYGKIATFAAAAHGTSASNYTATLDWGDGSATASSSGTTPALTIHDLGNGQFSITGAHSYSTAGSYAPSLTVTYNPTGDSATASGTATIADSGPAADWQLNSTSGTTVTDTSGYGNAGTLTGSTTPTWSGAPDGATGLFFDGTGQRVTVPDAATLDPTTNITIGAYVNAASWSSGQHILDKFDGTTTQYALYDDSGSLKMSLAGVGSVTAALPSADAWHAIVGTYNGSALKLYVDGSLANSATASGTPTLTTGELDLGDVPSSTTNGDSFNGTIAEAQVYDYALADATAAAAAFPAPTIATAAAATSSTVTGSTDALSVLGASPNLSESALSYSWAATTEPAGAPDPFFSANASNSAKSTTATFFRAGSYVLEAQVCDGLLTKTSSVSATVNQTLTSISMSPAAATVAHSNIYHLAATALDQFGNPMATQPTFTWAVTGGSSNGTVTSAGVYTAPSSGSGPYTVTATASSISGSTAITIGTTASTTSLPAAVTDAAALDGGDGSTQIVWNNGSGGGAIDGFKIEASTDGGTTYAPIGFAPASATYFQADGLVANMAYQFRVTPFNAAGSASTAATTGSLTLDTTSFSGWYNVAFADSATATSESFTLASTAHSGDSGTLSLTSAAIAAGGWVQATSAAAALRQALSGSLTSGYDSSTLSLANSGALKYVPDLVIGGNDLGPAIVAEDEYNSCGHGGRNYDDAYVLVAVQSDSVSVTVSTDQNGDPAGALNVGTFVSPNLGAAASAFTATVTWPDNTTSTGTIAALADGSFGVSVTPPTGENTSAYTLHVVHTATGVSGDAALGMTLSSTVVAVPTKAMPFSLKPPPTPHRPTVSIGTLPSGLKYVSVHWVEDKASDGRLAQRYKVSRRIDGQTSYTPVGTTPDGFSNTTLYDFTYPPSTKCFYSVTAESANGDSHRSSDSKAITTPALPTTAAPTELEVYTSGATSTNSTPTVSADGSNALPTNQVLTWKWSGSGVTFQVLRSLTAASGYSPVSGTPTLSGGFWHFTDTTANLPVLGDAAHPGDPSPTSGIYYYKVTATVSGVPSMPTPTTYAPQLYLKLGKDNLNGSPLADFFDKEIGCETHWYGADVTIPGDTTAEEQALNAQLNASGTNSPAALAGISFGGAESVGITYDTNDLGSHRVKFLALIDPVTPGSMASHPMGCMPNAHAYDVVRSNVALSIPASPYPGSNPPDPSSVFSPNTNVVDAHDWHQTYSEEYTYEYNHRGSGDYQGFATGTLNKSSQNTLAGDDHTSQVHVDDVWSTLKTQLTTLAGNGKLNSDGTRSWIVG